MVCAGSALAWAVAEGSIRLGILKAVGLLNSAWQVKSCRGLDPIGDTERAAFFVELAEISAVAEGSIRLGILKESGLREDLSQRVGCRGLDPIGDTESSAWPAARSTSGTVVEGSIRLGILKVCHRTVIGGLKMKLQRARSDWGY